MSSRRLRVLLVLLLVPVLVLLLVIVGAVAWTWAHHRPMASGHLRIVDQDGNPTTAMVCILDTLTDQPVLPSGAPAIPSLDQDFYDGFEYDGSPGWIGPVRRTNGPGNNEDRSFLYRERPSIPWWPEPVAWQAGPDLDLDLPEGRYRVSITRGPEVVPLFVDVELRADEPVDLELKLERWVTMADAGWYSADIHVHHPTLTAGQRAFVLQQARAADLQLVNALQLQGYFQAFDELPICDGPCLAAGQEDQRVQEGHTIGLDVRTLVDDPDPSVVAAGLHDQGALFGFAHFPVQGPVPSAFTAMVPRRELDFIESLQFAHSAEPAWAEYLDLGFRLTVAAGSDVPWGSVMGEVRTYVKIDGPFSVDAWFDGLEAGHSFVSSGPMLEFTVDDALPGSELERAAGDTVQLKARAWGHPAVGQPTELVVLGTGGLELARKEGEGELTVELPIAVDQSQWLTVLTTCENGARAHATPIYVTVDRAPTWSTDRGRLLVMRRLRDLDELEASLGDAPVQRALAERIAQARQLYRALAIPVK